MSSRRILLPICAAIIGITPCALFEGMAGAQMAPALGRDATPPQPPPPALGREVTPGPSTFGGQTGGTSKGTPAAPTAGKRGEGAAPLPEEQPVRESVQQRERLGSQWWSTTNAMTMSAAVLLFGLLVISFATYLIKVGKSSEAVLRIFGTILIIVIAVFLVVAGYSDTQIAPVMGLLGTIAGYLLGKESKDRPTAQSSPDAAQERHTS